MNKRKVIICIILTMSILMSSIGFAEQYSSDQKVKKSIEKAIYYLHSVQNKDGGFPATVGNPSSLSLTSWVIMALTAAGENITDATWTPKGKNPIDYIKNSKNILEETTDYARLLLALTATNQGTVWQGEDLAKKIISFQQSSGQFCQLDQGEKGMINSHMWSILALASSGHEIPNKEKAKKWLLSRQNEDGGFGWLEGVESDADDTGVAIQALVMLGENPKTSKAIKDAMNFIKKYQQEDGGFSSGEWMGNSSNSASDSWVLQGLIAAGEDPTSNRWSINGKNGITHLLSLQNSDGSFNWKEGVSSSTVTMTSYAIMALAQRPFPVNIDYKKKAVDEELFLDLSSNHWAYKAITDLVKKNILSGYPDGTFRPEKSVTRAEFTNLMICGLNLQKSKHNVNIKFKDVFKNHWAYNAISIAVGKGFIKGRSDKIFDPNGKITGAEMATMLVNSLPPEKKSKIKEGPYWYSGYVKIAKENDLLYPNFKAKESASRAQCAYSIMKLRNLLLNN
ncbi:hypothetical protein FQB35_02820 [Crassaminicella thermophila]|uniref:SLH domain-containing protein n=1 Tax=Crassaminicella thermophila TaxID=2599308 RepID=A0A5C0SBB9_CRATE|nr:S-layer homology domain-containing protein [Crassaminicella thermophila]QEK11390.1 hypothetical protein FQB35_02820 [Crassaminicella thermophila]